MRGPRKWQRGAGPADLGSGPVDAPLTAADEFRRAAQPPPLEPDPSRLVALKRWAWLAPVAVAATATILAAGLPGSASDRTPQSGPGSLPAPVVVPPGRAELIVRDGDLVEASGQVEDAELCAPAGITLQIGGDTCPYGIRVRGVRPTDAATLRGRWHANGLSDIRRMPYLPTSAGVLGDSDLPNTPPCPAPAGGWRDGEDWSDEQVRDYLHAHAERFAEPFATHVGNARILVVEVVSGSVDQARAALTAIYTDNLCVVAAPGKHSLADDSRLLATAGEAVGALMNDKALGIYLAGPEGGKMRVFMIQLTQPLYDKLSAIGLDHLVLDPWIRPVGR